MEDLKTKLEDESSRRTSAEKEVEKHLDTISNLERQISELKDACLTKANQITVLGEKNEDIKQELCEVKREADEERKSIAKLNEELSMLCKERDELAAKMETLASDRDQVVNDLKNQKRHFEGQVKPLIWEFETEKSSISHPYRLKPWNLR